ncbi:hypothetical protein TNCV_4430471 [Trichonephila clavipes]|nr:hypothetical protein TNCV_4430471 [Trichonephila clavipes]
MIFSRIQNQTHGSWLLISIPYKNTLTTTKIPRNSALGSDDEVDTCIVFPLTRYSQFFNEWDALSNISSHEANEHCGDLLAESLAHCESEASVVLATCHPRLFAGD